MNAKLGTALMIAMTLAALSSFAEQQPAPAASTPAAAITVSSKNEVAGRPESNSRKAPAVAELHLAAQTTGESTAREAPAVEPANEEDAFKYSPAVQFVSRTTRVSLTTAYWLCVAINFAILAVGILVFMKSSLPAMFRGRTQEIQKGIQDARRASEDAGRRLKDIEVRLSRLDVDIAEMQKQAENEARAEEERIRASIEEEKQKILQSTEQEVAQASETARRELQKYAAELAITVAKQRIHVDAAEDQLLVADFADQLASHTRANGNI